MCVSGVTPIEGELPETSVNDVARNAPDDIENATAVAGTEKRFVRCMMLDSLS